MYTTDSEHTPAGFFVRLAAYLLDLLIAGLMVGLIALPMGIARLSEVENPLFASILFRFSAYDILLYLAGVAYFVLMTYYTGTTLGKRAMNLRVVSEDSTRLTFINVLYRETIGRFLSSLLYIGYLMTGATQQKTALHDILCNTRVVYGQKVPPYMMGGGYPQRTSYAQAYPGYPHAAVPPSPPAPSTNPPPEDDESKG